MNVISPFWRLNENRENKQDISFLQSIYKSIELLQNKDKNKGEKKSMKKTLLTSLIVGAAAGVVFFTSGNDAQASEVNRVWTPRTVDQIKADIAKAKNNQYTIVWGDTLSGISQATNLTVQKLADLNKIANVDLIYAGNTLVFDGNVVTAKNDKGETVAQSVVTPQDKNDANKPVGKQEPTKQAEEKAPGTTASSQSQNKQKTTTTSDKTATSSQGTSAFSSGTNGSQTGTSGSVEGTTSSTAGTTASSGTVETPAQSSKPVTPSQPAEKPTTPTQPSTGGEQGGTTNPSETPKPTEPTIVRGEIGNSAGMKDQNGNVVSGLWEDGAEANDFGYWVIGTPDTYDQYVGFSTWNVYYSDGSEKTTVDFYDEAEEKEMAENWNN